MIVLRIALVAAALFAASAARAEKWKIDPAQSSLTFAGTQAGEKFTGKFSRFSAAISLDPQNLAAAHIEVTVDVASAVTGDRQRDEALPGKDWFDVKKFPQARFVSKEVRRAGDSYEADGDLTLRGVTKPVRLKFTLRIEGNRAEAKGHAQLMREDFGVGKGEWNSDQWVAFEVGVDFDLKAVRAP